MKKFHERFNLEVGLEEARQRFINRAHNVVLDEFLHSSCFTYDEAARISNQVLTILGDRVPHRPYLLSEKIGKEFTRTLQAVEAVYRVVAINRPDVEHVLGERIRYLLAACELDLSITWRDGLFLPTGAAVLDERLVNDVLDWLRRPGLESVVKPFENALALLLKAEKDPRLLPNVVTNAYEALEALSKIITKRDKDLSANRESFIQKTGASDGYRELLKDYVDYACRFRHAASETKPKPSLSMKEVEAFVYLTGLFLRFALRSTKPT